jgi:hypothetical protein
MDNKTRQFLEPEQKALEINLDNQIYGSFAEIGAGQEVARFFFKVGAAAGTIAKTISAYDKIVSDHVYGSEASGRYVCESRVYKMLDHEFELMVDRLTDERPNTCFFSFADTVETLNYHKTNKGSGWLGLRFQLQPQAEPNDLVLHVELLDTNTSLQQQAIGILGVNMIYACYRYHHDYKMLMSSLMDNIRDRIRIDMIRLTGPQFKEVDNRLLTLELVRQNMTDVAMFDKRGVPVHPSEFLYKKNVLVVRGSYRPATLVNMDMLHTATQQFKNEPDVQSNKTNVLTEITLDNLKSENGCVEDEDFLNRADLLGHLGQMVMISNCEQYTGLIKYLLAYRVARLGLVIGARPLLNLINAKYYQDKDGSLLTSFGELFTRSVRMYVYPAQKEGSGELMTAQNLPVPPGITHLYQHLLASKQIVDIEGFDPKILHIYSPEVLRMIRQDEQGWEQLVPPRVAKFVREKSLFGLPCQKLEFDY